jgi:hypothetical protein
MSRVIVLFVDALGPSMLERFGDRLAVAPHRRALRGVLGYSSGALATILTGEPPARHGRMCLFSRRAPGEPSLLAPLRALGLLPRLVHERARLRRWIAKAFAAAHGLDGYFALHRVPPASFAWLDVPERDDLFRAETIGGAPTFLARARRAEVDVLTARWQLPEAARFAEVEARAARSSPRLAFLYATEIDAVTHAEGSDGARLPGAIDRIARHLERVRASMARGGEPVEIVVVGDHGMADVVRVVDPRPLLPRGAELDLFVDSTMLRAWGAPAQRARLRGALERAGVEGQWLEREGLAARALPVEGAPYGEAIFVLDEGAIFAPSHVGGRVRGMHGYDLGTRSSEAAIASSAPLPAHVERLEHVAPHVLATLGAAS